MNFFKSLKSRLLGSVKEDLNSALSGGRLDFNSKIEDALKDLISLKTGIRLSNIPSIISEEAAQNAENRREVEKHLESQGLSPATGKPSSRDVLRFPTDNNRFVDNWIIFRTKPKSIPKMPHNEGDTLTSQQSFLKSHGFTGTDVKDDLGSKEYTVALYFPNNVKDTVSVSYEATDIGINDIMMNNLMSGEVAEAMGDVIPAVNELAAKAARGLDATRSFQTGVLANTPKFNTFSGVEFRDHSYTFQLNPYNVKDAEEITHIIHVFKMMMLPMSLADNKRLQTMPAEWSINFRGPILGSIEHPQNCFLKSCDVDYSGGKDMSFIEDNANPNQFENLPDGVNGPPNEIPRHYPNGITLSLVFQEILNLDRLRYIDRVAANAMGKSQDVDAEMRDFEMELEGQETQLSRETTEYKEWEGNPNKAYSSKESAEEFLTKYSMGGTHKIESNFTPSYNPYGYSYGGITTYKIVPKGEGE